MACPFFPLRTLTNVVGVGCRFLLVSMLLFNSLRMSFSKIDFNSFFMLESITLSISDSPLWLGVFVQRVALGLRSSEESLSLELSELSSELSLSDELLLSRYLLACFDFFFFLEECFLWDFFNSPEFSPFFIEFFSILEINLFMVRFSFLILLVASSRLLTDPLSLVELSSLHWLVWWELNLAEV